MSARKLAVQLLNRTEQEQSYSNLLLDSALSQSQLDERDKRLCASLYYGVIERRITLDAVLSHYSKQPLTAPCGTFSVWAFTSFSTATRSPAVQQSMKASS